METALSLVRCVHADASVAIFDVESVTARGTVVGHLEYCGPDTLGYDVGQRYALALTPVSRND